MNDLSRIPIKYIPFASMQQHSSIYANCKITNNLCGIYMIQNHLTKFFEMHVNNRKEKLFSLLIDGPFLLPSPTSTKILIFPPAAMYRFICMKIFLFIDTWLFIGGFHLVGCPNVGSCARE
uniref:Uncharacterized protein n=1 Tax=Onchocerca volvulus TaxID=6282 RepID=A0A8R1XT30_ONCVO